MDLEKKIAAIGRKLTPMDDDLFVKIANDRDFLEEMLRCILTSPELVVNKFHMQHELRNMEGRSVIVDVWVSIDGEEILIEVQKANDDDHQKRLFYESAVFVTNNTETGTKFRDVPNVIAIMIADFDIFGTGSDIYHVDRVVRENGQTVYNGYKEIYVNAKSKVKSDITEMMRVYTKPKAYNYEKFPVLSARKHQFTETEEGKRNMNKELAQLIEEREKLAEQKGKEKGKIEAMAEIMEKNTNKIITMIKDKLSLDTIYRYTEVPLEKIREIAQSRNLVLVE